MKKLHRVQRRELKVKNYKRKFWELGYTFPSQLVKDSTSLKKIYQLRYDVYCLQKKFLDPGDYPDKIETDVFDPHSLHFAAFDDLGNALGTLRLVMNSSFGFPMINYCELNVPDNILKNAGEISRLAVNKIIRKRQSDGEYGMAVGRGAVDERPSVRPDDNRRRHRPEIVVGLYKSLYQESRRHGISHWLAVMEPGLLKLLKRFHFNFDPIGPEFDYFGPVRPYMVSLESIEDQVYEKSKEFYKTFVEGLPPELIKYPH